MASLGPSGKRQLLIGRPLNAPLLLVLFIYLLTFSRYQSLQAPLELHVFLARTALLLPGKTVFSGSRAVLQDFNELIAIRAHRVIHMSHFSGTVSRLSFCASFP